MQNSRNYQKGVPLTAQISKLESDCLKCPTKLELGGEQPFWGTAHGVLFNVVYMYIKAVRPQLKRVITTRVFSMQLNSFDLKMLTFI